MRRARDQRTPPLEVVDVALRLASRRQFFTIAEALELLEGVRDKVDAPAVGGIVAEVASSYSDDVLVPQTQVVDSLLDVRLAVAITAFQEA